MSDKQNAQTVSQQALADELAAIQAEQQRQQAPGDPESSFSDALSAAGIEHTAAPKPSPEASAAPAEESPATPAFTTDGLEVAIAAATPTDRRQADSLAIKQDAISRGLSDEEAHHLAFHTPRQIAKNLLDFRARSVQSTQTAQSASAQVAPPSGGAGLGSTLAEVRSALAEGSGDETATVVASALESMAAEIQQLKGQAQSSVAAVRSYEDQQLRATVSAVASELQGRFPRLVQDGMIDPVVSQDAAALCLYGSTKGNWKASFEAAATSAYGPAGEPSRQATSNATAGPDTKAPTAARESIDRTKPISGGDMAQMLASVERKYAGDVAKIQSEYARIGAMVKEHNASLQR